MLIPRYWAKAEGSARGRNARAYRLRCWGVSATSQADAEADAKQRLAAVVRQLAEGGGQDGGYPYGRSVVREQLIHEVEAPDRGLVGIVTRNRYGALVLNAASALFLDVDLPRASLLRRILARFRGKPASHERRVQDLLCAYLAATPDEGFRVYRTAAGFRVLGTSRLHDPRDESTLQFMRAAGTDRAFVTLCRVQQTFRARLTPKPWRIGVPTPRWSYPFESPETAAALDAWSQRYEAACGTWATCTLAASIGPTAVHPEIAPVLALHDEATRVASGLPLA